MCHDAKKIMPTVTVNTPLDVLRLNETCIGSNDHMLLSQYFGERSTFNVVSRDRELLQLSKSSKSKVWAPLMQCLLNLTKINLSESLQKLKPIPLDQFITSLSPLPNVEIKNTGRLAPVGWNSSWGWVLFTIGNNSLYMKCIRYPSCLAIRVDRDLGRVEAQNGERMSVFVQNGPTSTNRGQPTHEQTQKPSDDEGRYDLYPRLGLIVKK